MEPKHIISSRMGIFIVVIINGWDWDTIRWSYNNPAPDRRDTTYYDLRFGGVPSTGGGVPPNTEYSNRLGEPLPGVEI